MILDIIFAAILIFAVIRGKKRGIVSVVLGIASTLLAVILSIVIRDAFAPQIEKMPIYQTARDSIAQKLSEQITLSDTPMLEALTEQGIEKTADTLMSVAVTAGIFLISILIIGIASSLIKGVFKLPVLNFLNGTLGMIWSGLIVIFITYILLILAQGFLSEDSFIMTQINSSYLIKFMYDNNFVYMMFSKGEKV